MKATAVILFLVTVLSGWAIAVEHWQQYGGDCLHNPVAETAAAPNLAQPRWTIQPNMIPSVSATPVVFENKVIVYGDADDYSCSYLAAYDIEDGSLVWQTAIDAASDESWSSPAVSPDYRCALIGSGQKVSALNVDTGELVWEQNLESSIYNSSIAVAGDRAFLGVSTAVSDTIYSNPEPQPGKMFALDLSADGAIVWQQQLGVTANCTAAVFSGPVVDYVIVADTDGVIRALNAENGSVVWTYTVPGAADWQYTPGGAFWGGVSISNGFLYASSYCFYGGQDNSFTYKLDAQTGNFIWRTPSERTDVGPTVWNGKVFVSGGLNDWGSVSKLEAFDDATGLKLWEYQQAGAYMLTPAIVNGKCYIGKVNYYSEIVGLAKLDLARTPLDANFEVESYSGAGGTVGYSDGSIYSVGTDGLCTFGELPKQTWSIEGDANLDCKVNIIDLIFVRNRLNRDVTSADNWQADVNSDGKINIIDLIYVRNRLNNKCSN